MAIITREFETMVDETLQRIINANIGITNTVPGSVVRTIVEALLAETDIQNYTIGQIYKAMNIDTATGSDLDAIVSILGVTRKKSTYAEGTVVFGRSDVYDTDIAIQYAQIVSTRRNNNTGDIYEFIVIDNDAKLAAGDLQVTVNIRAIEPGNIYLPINTITIMNTPIIGIEYVTNMVSFSSGTDEETDEELRIRAKQALAGLGKGSSVAIRSALLDLVGVMDAVVLDVSRGAGTADVIVITNEIPPSEILMNEISYTISITKSAGIDVGIIYPTIKTQDIIVTVTDVMGDQLPDGYLIDISDAIITYCNGLSVGDRLIISQLERAIGNALGNDDLDIIVTTPSANVAPSNAEVIRCGEITINGIPVDIAILDMTADLNDSILV